MKKTTDSHIGNLVRTTLISVRLSELSDGELLTRFVAARDEAAFTELVRRLGPTVYGVCHRVLRFAPDTEDAFQVTFLVLARRAACVSPPGRVAAWLHGVAMLVARKARATRARRRSREAGLSTASEPAAATVGPEPDLGEVLDVEIGRLPERYRLPFVLCEVRELTVAGAATELGWPVGTVASRLRRGRAFLARRLEGRGLARGVALVAAGAVADVAVARVPSRLVETTVSAAVPGGAGAPGASPQLLNEVLLAMMMNKIRVASFALIATAAVALSGVGLSSPADAAPRAAAPVPKVAPAPAVDHLARLKVNNLAVMVWNESVRKDIGLTKDQLAKLDTILDDQVAKLLQAHKAGESVYLGTDPELEKAVAGVVTTQQMQRLRQISLQAKGPAALLDHRVVRALGLKVEQEDKIDAILPEYFESDDDTPIEEAVELMDAVWADTLKVLTPGQRNEWNGLVGQMLPSADVFAIQSGRIDELWKLYFREQGAENMRRSDPQPE